MPVSAVMGNITQRLDDAIVNSANRSLWAGSGVCGAIYAAAGPELEAACRVIGPIAVGEAVVTPGFNLKARYVIHAVGPRWLGGGRRELELLKECYARIFDCLADCGAATVAMPSISTGVHHFPLDLATQIAVAAAMRADRQGLSITFVCFEAEILDIYRRQLAYGGGTDGH